MAKFTKGNQWAAQGGVARAAQLSAERRRQIAKMGFRALVEKRFDGDVKAAKTYLSRLGAWASDQVYAGTRIAKTQAFAHPGTIEEFSAWFRAVEPIEF